MKVMRLQVTPGEVIRGRFELLAKDIRTTNCGEEYAFLVLESGGLLAYAYLFEGCRDIVGNIEEGEHLYILGMGKSTLYRPVMKVLIIGLDVTGDKTVILKEKWMRFLGLMDSVKRKHFRTLLNRFLTDRELMERFINSSAGFDRHHISPGGLIDHTTSVIELVLHLSDVYFEKRGIYVDKELLIVGGFLHDLGKTVSMGSESVTKVPLGHVGQGMVLLDRLARGIPRFPERDLFYLYHIIDSHHSGRGSPIQPLIREAKLICLADRIDAYIDSCIGHLKPLQ